MKIDIHVHSQERSGCAHSSEEDNVLAAIKAGLDAIVFTDHDTFCPPDRLAELNERYSPFRIFGGIEVSCEDHHFVVTGVSDHSLEQGHLAYSELHDIVRGNNGSIVLAHPYRYGPLTVDIEKYRPDALEYCTKNTPEKCRPEILTLAEKLDLPLVCASDAHDSSVVGKYFITLDTAAADENELAEALVAGCFRCSEPVAGKILQPHSK